MAKDFQLYIYGMLAETVRLLKNSHKRLLTISSKDVSGMHQIIWTKPPTICREVVQLIPEAIIYCDTGFWRISK